MVPNVWSQGQALCGKPLELAGIGLGEVPKESIDFSSERERRKMLKSDGFSGCTLSALSAARPINARYKVPTRSHTALALCYVDASRVFGYHELT